MRRSPLVAALLRALRITPPALPTPGVAATPVRHVPAAPTSPSPMKRQARLEKWSLTELGGHHRLRGVVFGHDEMPDGSEAITSTLVWIDHERGIAETRHTVYTLGAPLQDRSPAGSDSHAR